MGGFQTHNIAFGEGKCALITHCNSVCAESDVVGLKATYHLNLANKTPKELQLMLQKIPQPMLDKI